MSHELRNPLTANLGCSDLLSGEDDISEDHSIALRAINGSAEHLRALIGEALDVSKVEAGHLEVEAVTFDLAEVIKRTVQALRQQAVDAGITLDAEGAQDDSPMIQSDPFRILKTLNNPLKFTPDEGVKARVSAEARSAPEVGFQRAPPGFDRPRRAVPLGPGSTPSAVAPRRA
jgi:signal transduction histidine kinase